MKLPFDADAPTPTDPWTPYEPDEKSPCNLRRVVHLHRRAGFAPTSGEIRPDLKDGPQASIDRRLRRQGPISLIGVCWESGRLCKKP